MLSCLPWPPAVMPKKLVFLLLYLKGEFVDNPSKSPLGTLHLFLNTHVEQNWNIVSIYHCFVWNTVLTRRKGKTKVESLVMMDRFLYSFYCFCSDTLFSLKWVVHQFCHVSSLGFYYWDQKQLREENVHFTSQLTEMERWLSHF